MRLLPVVADKLVTPRREWRRENGDCSNSGLHNDDDVDDDARLMSGYCNRSFLAVTAAPMVGVIRTRMCVCMYLYFKIDQRGRRFL